jgi:hypothetical protein
MKKTNIILVAVCAAVVAFIVTNQPAVSQSAPPSTPPAFTAHYSEINTQLTGGQSSPTYTLPVLNRAVRMSFSFVFDDGEYTFFEPLCFYAVTRGEFNVSGAGPINNELAWPDGLGFGGVTLFGGTNGTFHFRNESSVNATMHVGLWY